MLLYADENDINKYLYDNYSVKSGNLAGSETWIGYDLYDKSTETALSFNASVTSITVADGTIYKAGMYLKSGTEILFVTAVTGNVLTVIRGFKSTTAAIGTTLAIQTAAEKVQIAMQSTEEINAYHNLNYQDFLFLETELQEVAILNALEISKLLCAYNQAEYIGAVTSGSYDDRVLSVSGAGSRRMSARIIRLIDQILESNGIDAGLILRR